MNRLNIYKTHPDIVLPKFATKGSACFDLSFQSGDKTEYTGYNAYNAQFTRALNGAIVLMPGERIMVPTGLIFDIPEGYSVRIHPRSGLSYKQGLVLANLEAVIDSDYVQETFVLLTNTSENPVTINNGDRIAQAEMIKSQEYVLWEIFEAPTQKTERVGGLGSTGVATATYVANPDAPLFMTEEDAKKYAIPTEQPIKRGRGRPRKNPILHHAV